VTRLLENELLADAVPPLVSYLRTKESWSKVVPHYMFTYRDIIRYLLYGKYIHTYSFTEYRIQTATVQYITEPGK